MYRVQNQYFEHEEAPVTKVHAVTKLINDYFHSSLQGIITHPCTNLTTLEPRQNGRHFADDMFSCIFLHENIWITIEISLKYVPKGSINNNPALFQIMAWRRPGDKPLSEPMMVSSLTHICVTRPQWVNGGLCLQVKLYIPINGHADMNRRFCATVARMCMYIYWL